MYGERGVKLLVSEHVWGERGVKLLVNVYV